VPVRVEGVVLVDKEGAEVARQRGETAGSRPHRLSTPTGVVDVGLGLVQVGLRISDVPAQVLDVDGRNE